jgi:crotonobetainyl-CoA:carnitine CoA-transferase CaiB-like acyl-CoA transferase
MSILKNIHVIEFAQGVAGPLAAVRLSDLGAEVIKWETGSGDWLRAVPPFVNGTAIGATFFELNRGKKSQSLGDTPLSSKDQLLDQLKTADVFITDRHADELKAMGLEGLDGDFYAPNPRLVRVFISPWGSQGPWSKRLGSELTAQAMAGYTRYLGSRTEPACRLGADVASTGTGIFTVQAVLAALLAIKRGLSQGQCIQVSLLNSLIALKSIHLAAQSDPDTYAGPRVGGANYPPERGWKTKDEPIFFAFGGSVGASGRPGWVKFAEEAGFTSLLEDARFDPIGRTTTGYGSKVQEVRGDYEREFARYTAEELVTLIRKYSGNAASYQRLDQALRHPQTTALEVIQTVMGPGTQDLEIRAFTARFSRSKLSYRGHCPALGEHVLATDPKTA